MHILRLTEFPSKKEISTDKNAFITHGLALTHILPLSRELKKKGVNSSVFSGGARRRPSFEDFSSLQVFRTGFPQKPYYLPYGFSLKLYWKKIVAKSGKVDVIHSHNPAYSYSFAVMPWWMPKKPLLITVHGSFPFDSIEEIFLKKLAKKAFFVVINKPARQELLSLGVEKKRIEFITTGVDMENFRDRKLERKNILFAGRFVWWKNLPTLLEAFEIALEKHPELKLQFVGTGPEEEKFKEIVNQKNLGNKVKFSGVVPISEMPRFYSQAIATVAPHIYDSFGKTIIESLACNTPVIATNHDIPKNIEECGLFYDYKKAKDSKILAEKILQMVEDREMSKKLGRKGRKVVEENYSWKYAAERYLKVYENLLEGALV